MRYAASCHLLSPNIAVCAPFEDYAYFFASPFILHRRKIPKHLQACNPIMLSTENPSFRVKDGVDETLLRSLRDFLRQTVGVKFAEIGHNYRVPQNAERDHWTYFVDAILGTDKLPDGIQPQPNPRSQENISSATKLSKKRAAKKAKRKAKKLKKEVDGDGKDKDVEGSSDKDVASGSNQDEDSENTPALPVGIKNMGKTCYMNAAFQFLLRPLGFHWLDLDEREAANGDGQSDIVIELHKMWRLLLLNNFENDGRAIDLVIGNLIPNIHRAWTNFLHPTGDKLFDSEDEEDAAEFLAFIFDRALMERQCSAAVAVESVDIVKCRRCSSEKSEPSGRLKHILFLVVRDEKIESPDLDLEDLLEDNFRKANKPDGSICCECKGNDLLNYSSLSRTSDFLIMQLNRRGGNDNHRDKLTYKVHNIPKTLDLKPYFIPQIAPGNARYKLYAVIAHIGQSWNAGHYVAAVLDDTSKTWFLFNDELVEILSNFEEKVGDDAYILLYKKMTAEDDDNEGMDEQRARAQELVASQGAAPAVVRRRVEEMLKVVNEQGVQLQKSATELNLNIVQLSDAVREKITHEREHNAMGE